MPSRPPFFVQGRRDSCALACLRMLLAHGGIEVSEEELVEDAAPLRVGLERLSLVSRTPGLPHGTGATRP